MQGKNNPSASKETEGLKRETCAQVGATCLVYFLGVRASVSSTRRQYFSTEGMKQRSLGV